MVVITFEGKKLPKEVRYDRVICPVEIYIPGVVQCTNCLRYGHTHQQCRGKVHCSICAGPHKAEQCDNVDYIRCFACKGEHKADNYKLCPVYKQEKKIKKIMAQRDLSFKEAVQYLDTGTHSESNSKGIYTPLDSDFPRLKNLGSDMDRLQESIRGKEKGSKSPPLSQKQPSYVTVTQRVKETPTIPRRGEVPPPDMFYPFSPSQRGGALRSMDRTSSSQDKTDESNSGVFDSFRGFIQKASYYIRRTANFWQVLFQDPFSTIMDLLMYCFTNTSD